MYYLDLQPDYIVSTECMSNDTSRDFKENSDGGSFRIVIVCQSNKSTLFRALFVQYPKKKELYPRILLIKTKLYKSLVLKKEDVWPGFLFIYLLNGLYFTSTVFIGEILFTVTFMYWLQRPKQTAFVYLFSFIRAANS